MGALIAFVILIIICVTVKLFDDDIRKSKYGKQIVVYSFLACVAYLLISLIMLIF